MPVALATGMVHRPGLPCRNQTSSFSCVSLARWSFPHGTSWGIPGSEGLRLAASEACVSPLTMTPPDSPLPPVKHLRVEVDDGPVNDDILATQFPVE